MSETSKQSGKVTPPVLLCRLCHTEFTNFKEHVKSLVHLDARETKSNATPPPPPAPPRNKRSREARAGADKKQRIDSTRDKDNIVEIKTIDNGSSENKINEEKEPAPSDIKADELSIKEENPSNDQVLPEKQADIHINGTDSSKLEDNSKTEKTGSGDSDNSSANSKDLTQKDKILLEKHWQCDLCDHVHSIIDETFEEHALDEYHHINTSKRLESISNNTNWKAGTAWLLNCHACAFHTNSKAQFISHLDNVTHEQNVRRLMETKTSDEDVKGVTDQKTDIDEKSDTPAKSEGNVKNDTEVKSDSIVKKDTSSKVNKQTKEAPKSNVQKERTNRKPSPAKNDQWKRSKPGKSRGSSNSRNYNKQVLPPKSSPKPLMSLSLPETLKKNKSVWKSSSTAARKELVNKPGILGEYRPSQSFFNFDGPNRDDRFGLCDRQDSAIHPGIRSGSPPGRRSAYSDMNSDILSSRTRDLSFDSLRRLLVPERSAPGSNRYDSVWAGPPALSSSSEKLNPLAFGRSEPEPSRQFDALSNLLSTQRPGMLPSVSLDLASNSSFRLKSHPDRSSMFDNYPGPRKDRMDSRPDHFHRSLFSRR